jgi:squalene-hopene/tetraprenyl-beta-curcumene cyclase
MALLAAREEACEEVTRGIGFLLDRQKPDGTWDEPEFTATGFPTYFMINYHNYRNCFPLMALGKFMSLCNAVKGGS